MERRSQVLELVQSWDGKNVVELVADIYRQLNQTNPLLRGCIVSRQAIVQKYNPLEASILDAAIDGSTTREERLRLEMDWLDEKLDPS